MRWNERNIADSFPGAPGMTAQIHFAEQDAQLFPRCAGDDRVPLPNCPLPVPLSPARRG